MLKCALRMLQPSIADLLGGFQDRGRSRNDRGRSRKTEEDRGRSRKIEEDRGDRGRSREIERSRKIEEDRGRSRKRSRKIEEKIEEDRGKIEEDRGRSGKIEENTIPGISRFWAVFPTMMFCGFFGQFSRQ